MPKAKNEEAESLSKSEKAKLQRLYREGKAAYGSVQNLQKASGLSKKKVTDFLHRKNSYTKFRRAIRHFKRLPAFAKRINEIWCLDLALMDKLSEFNNGVKYLLICVDVFSRLVRVQSMKSKYASDAVAAFKKMLRKNTKPDKVWVDQGTEFGGEFKKFCKSRDIKIYSTRSETKAAVAERAIRSLKNIFYCYMEENGDKYVQKMDSFVNTMNTRVNRSIGKSPKNVKNSDFLSIFYKNPIIEYKKPRFKIGDKVRISKYDIPFRKDYKSQFTSEVFEIVKIATLKPPTYNLHGEQGDEILGKFYEQELAKCII